MPNASLIDRLAAARERAASRHCRRQLRLRDISVVSDDCWGGRVYAELGLKCHSPFVGMGIKGNQYLDFLCGMREPGALDVLGVSSQERGYPVIRTRNANLLGMHYKSDEDFVRTFERRRETILWDRLFIKVDFGKGSYTPEHIERWNALKFPNSVALYPDTARYRAMKIHNGVALPDWELDGVKQFLISCRRFDIFDWINDGVIRLPVRHRLNQLVLMERMPGQRLARFLRLLRLRKRRRRPGDPYSPW